MQEEKIALSVIIPFLNESSVIDALLANIEKAFPLHYYLNKKDELLCEFIFVDGGSSDDSKQKIQDFIQKNARCSITSSEKGRAKQMNAGALEAKGECCLFLHADTRLPDNTVELLLGFLKQKEKVWGSFSMKFDDEGVVFRLLAWMINRRSGLTQVVTGDQALFVRSDIFKELKGFPDIPLMEDVAMTKSLREYSQPFRIKDAVMTSSRRWKSKGLIRTILMMWFLRFAYLVGIHPKRLVSWYYPDA